MTSDLRLLSGFARGVSLSLHVRVTCLHSGSWLLSGFLCTTSLSTDEYLRFGIVQPVQCPPDSPLDLLLPTRPQSKLLRFMMVSSVRAQHNT